MTARLKKAIEHILHLHCCEQEGIDMPTPKMWMEGVDDLSEAFEEAKDQSEPECKGCRCHDFEMVYKCKDCGKTRVHPVPDPYFEKE